MQQTEAALNAIAGNVNVFAADELTRLDSAKVKALRLPAKFAYFQGGSTYHRVAVVCPLSRGINHDQLLIGGLIWANKVSNGQKTILYLVGERFCDQLGHMIQLFGPQIEVRLAYYTPKLSTPFLVTGRDARANPPRYLVPKPKGREYWEYKFNPVERGWFATALAYFMSFASCGVSLAYLDNWVSIKFKGLEVARISKKDGRLRIALITRYPREIPGTVGNREEIEGWINAQGRLNEEFMRAFEQRLNQLQANRQLFARVCPEKQRLEYLIQTEPQNWGLEGPVLSQLEVSAKGEPALTTDLVSINQEGNLTVCSIHPQRDLGGFAHCLQQLTWAKVSFQAIKNTYFHNAPLGEPEGWLICPEQKLHPDLEILRSLMWPSEKIKLLVLNKDWQETGTISIKWQT